MSRRQKRERQRRRRSATRPRPSHTRLATGAGISLAAALGAPAAAQATDFTVTTTADPVAGTCDLGDCSLREAIEAAEANATDDRILFQAGLTGAIALGAQGDLYIDEPLEVLGPGAAALTVSGPPSGANERIFNIYPNLGDPVTISGLTLSGADIGGAGAAIRSFYADLTIRNLTVSGNTAATRGGGIVSYGGTTTIEDSTFVGNDSYIGGAISTMNATTTIEGSTIAGNDASYGGGGVADEGTTTIVNSTISGNDAADYGGGVFSSVGTTTIESSTISGNEATIKGGGVWSGFSPTDATLANTIVADNTAPTAPDGPDLFSYGAGDEFDASFSLIGSTSGATVNETVAGSNITGQSAQLGPLAANGGPTETMAPAPTSPAVNRGSSFGATTDQRGLPRPVAYPGVPFSTAAGADGADIGAFELQAPPPPPPPPAVSNRFAFGKLTLNRRRGIAILRVRVPGAGRVILLRNRRVRRAVRNPAGRRVVRLPVRARGKFRKRLLRTGRVRVRARVRFRPTGGAPRTKSRRVRLVKRKRR